MKKTKKECYRLGDLIAALYDEAEKETQQKKFQSALVALALLDVRSKIKREIYSSEHKVA